ncbi:MAG TPA: tyrosine-type recombinase/integrase [Terriglobia bacterium]|nr:tyrosine-type recombinase/integrase [Terriglobia bacterium]
MARPRNTRGSVYPRKDTAFWWIRYRGCDGHIKKESSETTDREEAERFLRVRLTARDEGRLPAILSSKNLIFNEWADWFLERRSKPPVRSPNTHSQNMNALNSLRPVFGPTRLSEITPEAIEDYLSKRLADGRKINTKFGQIRRRRIKPATVHQEFRVLTHILNVAIRQKKLQVNPCNLVEFPVSVKNSTRKPHYMTSSEQERIEVVAHSYLRHVVVIMTETGLRPFKELIPMLKSQVDLENRLVHVSDSKTENGIGDMPLTEPAYAAFKEQMEEAVGSDYLFPRRTARGRKPYLRSLKKVWRSTLKQAGVPYFSLYELRHTFATRLSAGGVADHFVTLMLRQGHAGVFKRYSQAKLNMMREALDRLDRRANEHERSFGTARSN